MQDFVADCSETLTQQTKANEHDQIRPRVEYRGAFNVAKTNTAEIFSDNFARLSKVADKVTIVRSVVGKIPDHAQATYHLFTGYTPTTVIDYPQMGSVISQAYGPRKNLRICGCAHKSCRRTNPKR